MKGEVFRSSPDGLAKGPRSAVRGEATGRGLLFVVLGFVEF